MCISIEERTREGRGVRRGTGKVVTFGKYNIRSGRNGGLELALCRMDKGQVDCGVLQEIKLIDRVYTQESSGFMVTVMAASSAYCGGITIFYRKAEKFATKELRLHSPNVISF